jgi:hypothetical protein
MSERPYSRFTRSKTWAALYCQHINACYALVPYSATNNSIAVIWCQSPEETQELMRTLLTQAEECAAYYGRKQTPDQAPALIAKARHAVVLARQSAAKLGRRSARDCGAITPRSGCMLSNPTVVDDRRERFGGCRGLAAREFDAHAIGMIRQGWDAKERDDLLP